MEDIEVSVFDPNAVKVGRGKYSSVKGGGILMVPFASYPYKMSVFSNAPVRDISSRLRLPFLIEEDDGVKVGLSPIVSYPSLTRVVWVLELTSEGGGKADRFRRGGRPSDGGVVLGETDGFVRVDTIFTHVGVNEVDDARDKEKVLHRFEIAVRSFEGFIIESIVA